MSKPTLLFVIGVMMSLQAHTRQANSVSVNATSKQQTITGFGAAIAYFDNWVVAHPKLYNLIFRDLNLGILRVRNTHGYANSSTTDMQEIVSRASTSLGHPVEILLTSWSPPARMNGANVVMISKNREFTGTAQEIISIQVLNPVGLMKTIDQHYWVNNQLLVGEDWRKGLYIILIIDRLGTKSYKVLKEVMLEFQGSTHSA